MNPDELRARAEAIEAELRTIHTEAGDANLNDEQQTRWDALEKEEADVREGIRVHEERAAQAAKTAERRNRWNSVQISAQPADRFADLDSLRYSRPEEMRSRAIAAMSEVRYDGPFRISDAARESAVRMVETIPGADALAMATSSPAYLDAFRSWLAAAGSPVYTQREAESVRAAMSLTSANGGYVLPFLLDPTLIHTGTATKNPVRRIARVETGTQNIWHGVTVSNVTTAWKGEGSAYTDGSPTTTGPTITAAALTAYVIASMEVFQDSNLQAQLPGLIAESIDYAEGTAFISGSGSTAPKGIVTAISATVACTVTATTRGTFNSTSSVDTIALLNSVGPRYEENVTWVGNKATFNSIRQQTFGTAGNALTEMSERNSLLGSPWASSSDMVSATTSGNVMLVLGDFSRFVVYDRLGVNLEFIPNVVDGSGIPTGQRGLVAYKRVGSDCVDLGAFRFLKA